MNEADSHMAACSIAHAASMAQITWQEAAYEHARPSVVYRPKLTKDGNQWCFLFGDNLQDGVAGFGKTPAEAAYAFDQAWRNADGK